MGYYKDLEIWQIAVLITKMVYTITSNFPRSEQFSLVDQMKRASVSIVSNIAEGSGRSSIPDNLRFLYMAQGSCLELESQLFLSRELGFVTLEKSHELEENITLLQKKLFNFIRSKKSA